MTSNAHIEKKRLDTPPATIKFKIQRREKEGMRAYWETFELHYRRNLNVISALMEIRKNPVTIEGKQTTPPVWDMSCLEQVCGICTMVIDGKVRQSCSALIDDLLLASNSNTVTLAPMSKFSNVRDLKVDRSKMFDHLKQVGAWIELDGTYDLGPGPHIANETAQERYALSRCMTCGCCLEACPQYGDDNYRPPGHRPGPPLQHAPDRRDHHGRPPKRPPRRRRHHQLRQRPKLHQSLPNVAPTHKSHLRNESRHHGQRDLWVVEEVKPKSLTY